MYHNSTLSKFAFRTKIDLIWPFFVQKIPFFVFCFITNIYIWYIVGSRISRSSRLQYFQIHKRYVSFLIMLFVYFLCQGRSFMLTALITLKNNLCPYIVPTHPPYMSSKITLKYSIQNIICLPVATLYPPLPTLHFTKPLSEGGIFWCWRNNFFEFIGMLVCSLF